MAMMNLTRLQDEAGTRIRNSSILDAQWTIWANLAQCDIASKIELNYLEHEVSVTTVDGTRTYYVDEFLPGLILSVYDETNAEHLAQRSEAVLLEWDMEQDSEGNPTGDG